MTIIEHLRNQLKEKEEYCIKITTFQRSEVPEVGSSSEKFAAKIVDYDIINDSDSAFNTDSGSETGKLPGNYMTKLSKVPRLSRSLSDVHTCKKLRDQYLSRGQQLQNFHQHTQTLYPNHRNVQRPRDVKKRHWRKSFSPNGMVSFMDNVIHS